MERRKFLYTLAVGLGGSFAAAALSRPTLAWAEAAKETTQVSAFLTEQVQQALSDHIESIPNPLVQNWIDQRLSHRAEEIAVYFDRAVSRLLPDFAEVETVSIQDSRVTPFPVAHQMAIAFRETGGGLDEEEGRRKGAGGVPAKDNIVQVIDSTFIADFDRFAEPMLPYVRKYSEALGRHVSGLLTDDSVRNRKKILALRKFPFVPLLFTACRYRADAEQMNEANLDRKLDRVLTLTGFSENWFYDVDSREMISGILGHRLGVDDAKKVVKRDKIPVAQVLPNVNASSLGQKETTPAGIVAARMAAHDLTLGAVFTHLLAVAQTKVGYFRDVLVKPDVPSPVMPGHLPVLDVPRFG